MTDEEPLAGINLPAELFPAALLGALIRQAGGSVTVSEEIYRREAARIMEGLRSQLNVERGPAKGKFTVHIDRSTPST